MALLNLETYLKNDYLAMIREYIFTIGLNSTYTVSSLSLIRNWERIPFVISRQQNQFVIVWALYNLCKRVAFESFFVPPIKFIIECTAICDGCGYCRGRATHQREY